MSERGLITVSNEVYRYALECRDKYLNKENRSALKLKELVKEKLTKNQYDYENDAKTTNMDYKILLDFETKLLQSLVDKSEK